MTSKIITQTDKKALTIFRYFDMKGQELRISDSILDNGVKRTIYLTENSELGIDSTNPKWIERGWATIGEYGLYPLNEEMLNHIVKI